MLDPLLESAKPLDDDTVRVIQDTNDDLLNAEELESIDLPIASLLTDRLYDDACAKDDQEYQIQMLDKQIEINYLLVNMTKRISSFGDIPKTFRKRGMDALSKLLEYLDKDKFLALSDESREIVLTDSRYGAALYENMDSDEDDLILGHIRILEDALKISRDRFYHKALPGFDWKYHVFRIYDYLSQSDTRNQDMATRRKIAKYTEKYMKLWRSDPGYYNEFSEYIEIEGARLRNNYLAGSIPKEEYLEKIYEIFRDRDPNAYTSAGFAAQIGFPTDYISFLEDEDIDERETKRIDEFYRSALASISHLPKMGLLSVTLELYARMLYEFRELPGNITFEEMGIRSLAALHPPTYIHSQMVARISRCLAEHLIRLRPELFDDVSAYLKASGYTGRHDYVEDHEEAPSDISSDAALVLDYTWHAAMCHDFGKIMIIDTILVYGRKLLDFEFRLIQSHPKIGASLLSEHDSTRLYAPVARGHHLWYDLGRGYPDDFDTFKSPVKVIIDIAAVADCMDAATDGIGRSYNKGKTLEEYTEEVDQGAGSRYAPWAADLLHDPKVQEELRHILEHDRMQIYKETYSVLGTLD